MITTQQTTRCSVQTKTTQSKFCWLVFLFFGLTSLWYASSLRARPRQVSKRSDTRAKTWSRRQIVKFHRTIPVLDLHADTLYQLTRRWRDLRRHQPSLDLDRLKLRRGGVGAQVFVMWVPPRTARQPGGSWYYLKRMYRNFQRMLRENTDWIAQARTQTEVRALQRQGKVAALLSIEGLHPLGGDLRKIALLQQWGVVYAGLTWNNSNAFATSAKDERRKAYRKRGLTRKGHFAVQALEKARILVDLSHAGRRTFWDVAKIAKRPIIASHSDAHQLRPHYRNLTDRQIRAIAKSGGVVGLNFYTAYLRGGRAHRKTATLRDVWRHAQHMIRVAGIDHVALGSDFDGLISKPQGLRHCGQLPNLTKVFLKVGLTPQQIRKILGYNVLRLLPK